MNHAQRTSDMPSGELEGIPPASAIQALQDDEYSFPYHYISQFRGGFAQCYNDTWGINYVSTIEFILGRLRNERFERLIDVGCGDGRLTCEIARDFPAAAVVGVDYSARAINLAKAMSPSGTYIAADIGTEDLGATFDGAVLMEVFEHIPPELCDHFLHSLAKLLGPGGFLYVTVPHINKAVEYKHFRHFSSSSLIASFTSYFDVVEVTPFERACALRRILDGVLTNRLFILHHSRIRNWLYGYYKRRLFDAQENTCQRLFAKMIRRND